MKKLLFVLTSYPSLGGPETVTGNLSEILAKDYEIYTLSQASDTSVQQPKSIKHSYRFPEPDIKANAGYYNSLIAELEIDCVINMGMSPCLTEIIFNPDRNKSVKVVSILHGMPGYEKKRFWLQNSITDSSVCKKITSKFLSYLNLNSEYRRYIKFYRNAYRKSTIEGDLTILWADGYKRHYINEYNLQQYHNKMLSLPNPLSKSYSKLMSPDWNSKKNQVVYVGHLVKEERLDLLIEVWKTIRHQDWELIVVGDGPLRNELEMKSLETDNIKFTGFRQNPSEYYEKAKVVILTSSREGFGMSLLEGMGYGAYPVTFDIGYGVRALLSDGGGTILPDGNVGIMSIRLENMLRNENLLRILSSKAYKRSKGYLAESAGVKWSRMFYNLLK